MSDDPSYLTWLWDNRAIAGLIAFYALVLILLVFSKSFRRVFFRPLLIFSRSLAVASTALVGVKYSDDSGDRNQARLEEILNAVRNRPTEAAALSAEAEAEIVGLFRTALEGTFAGDIRQEIRLLVREQFQREVEHEASKFLDEVKSRLQAASSTVTVRGFLNLMFGIGFAGAALYLLKEAVEIFSPAQLSTLSPAVALYLIGIRVSLALLITVISYFFLSLYRRSLDEAKYYQNELTNISAISAGLQLAYYTGDADTKKSVVSQLISTDRNAEASSAQASSGLPSEALITTLIEKLPNLKGA